MACLIFWAPVVMGVPANPRLQPVVQPDGSVIMARLAGDEHGHLILSDEGLPIERGNDGLFRYIVADRDGTLSLSEFKVNPEGFRTHQELTHIAAADRAALREACVAGLDGTPARKMRRRLPPDAKGFPCTGSPRGLVLLIEYSDVWFTVDNPHDSFSRMLNEEGYSDFGAWGSARDWFRDNSGGRFTPQFDVVGPIRLDKPRAWYGENRGSEDIRPEMMIIEACQAIDSEIDFSLYDEDNDGYIDNIFAFYAGYGENLGVAAPSECIWPHSWDIEQATPIPYYFDGVRLNHYACTNEIDLSDMMDGIGTFVHEFSHVMGLPDLYATNYSSAFTPGSWSVMDEGPYNNNSRTPPLYSSFERLSLGWLDPICIDRPQNIKLAPVSENRAYYIPTDSEEEYFLIENRQQTGWDTFIPYHGMLVWHIDYNENIWRFNTVNDRKDHQYVDLIEADNSQRSDDRAGDCFPGTAGVTSFTDDTEPAMRSWSGQGCGTPLTDIFESNGYIYLKACGGKDHIDSPVAIGPEDIGVDSFTARWNAADEDGYESIVSIYTVSVLGSGQTVMDYAFGYENLNTGSGSTSLRAVNLVPGGSYRYTVRFRDPESGRESPASNEVAVTLEPPTFDYLTPVALGAGDVAADGFTARWEPMEDADNWILTVRRKESGRHDTVSCGFDGGLSSLPVGWSTNSRLTYAAPDYCGTDVPSLRFNAEGQYLEMDVPEGYAESLGWWMRGVGVSDDARLELKGRINGEWISLGDYAVTPGPSLIPADGTVIPFGAESLRIVFHPGSKGSVAIDDVVLMTGSDIAETVVDGYDGVYAGEGCSFRVTGLDGSTPYFYTVRAAKGGVLSRQSNEICVVTASSGSGAAVLPASVSWRYDRPESTLVIEGLSPAATVVVATSDGAYTIRTRSDMCGTARAVIPWDGLWIVSAPGFGMKFMAGSR